MASQSVNDKIRLNALGLIGYYLRNKDSFIRLGKTLVRNRIYLLQKVSPVWIIGPHNIQFFIGRDKLVSMLKDFLEHDSQWNHVLDGDVYITPEKRTRYTESMCRYIVSDAYDQITS